MTTRRARSAVGGTRVSAFWRLVGLFVMLAVDTVLLPIAFTAALIYMAVDVLFSIVLDRRASGNGLIMGALKGLFTWVVAIHKWILFGRDFPGFIPTRR